MFRSTSLFIGTSFTVTVFTIFAASNVDSIVGIPHKIYSLHRILIHIKSWSLFFLLQVECRLEHYASCYFLRSLGLGLPTQYACRPIRLRRRNGEEASPFRSLLPLDTEINFTNFTNDLFVKCAHLHPGYVGNLVTVFRYYISIGTSLDYLIFPFCLLISFIHIHLHLYFGNTCYLFLVFHEIGWRNSKWPKRFCKIF